LCFLWSFPTTPPKGTSLAGTTQNDVLIVGMCPKMRPVGVTKKGKNGQKLSCVKLAICPDHPRRHRPLKFFARGHVRELVIYFKFHENRSRGLGAMGGTTVQAVITRLVLSTAIKAALTCLSKLFHDMLWPHACLQCSLLEIKGARP